MTRRSPAAEAREWRRIAGVLLRLLIILAITFGAASLIKNAAIGHATWAGMETAQ